MAETAANLVEHVLPERAALRQFVLTLPFELRARLAYDGKLLGAVCHTFVDSVLGWYRRHFEARRLSGSKGGAVTTVQRVSSDLRLNPHFHTLCLDGVYVEDEDSKLIFHPLPCLTNGDVADILQIGASSACTTPARVSTPPSSDQTRPIGGAPSGHSEAAEAAPSARALPYPLDRYYPSLDVLAAESWLCGRAGCGSPWRDPNIQPPTNNGQVRGVPSGHPTRACERDVFAPGNLVGVGTELKLVTLAGDSGRLAWRSKHTGQLVRSLPLANASRASSFASAGKRIFVAFENGWIKSFPHGPSFMAPAGRSGGPDEGYTFTRLWANAEDLLWVDAVEPGDLTWTTASTDGRDVRTVVEGGVGRCGRPLAGRRVLALAARGRVVLSFSLERPTEVEVVAGNPLTTSYCVAGAAEVLAVTGRLQGLPAVAIHDGGKWYSVRFPNSVSRAEPVVYGDRIFVSLPEEEVAVTSDATPLAAAGAVYVLGRGDHAWQILERIVAATPRERGLFGFSIAVDDQYLFINHLVASPEKNGARAPVVCRSSLGQASVPPG